MAVYSLLVVLVGVALCVDHVTGLHSERQEERKRVRGRLHQLCQKLLDGETVTSESLRTAHDRIRHRQHKNKCKIHMRTEKRCIKRYKPSNSTIHSFHDNFFGWVINIACIRGYELKGRSFVKCYEDLHKAEKPFCQIRDCGRPTYHKDTAYIYNTTTFGSRLHVRCGRDFNLTGPSSAKCLASGRWMAISRCVKWECPDPKPPHYGTYNDTKNAQNVRTVLFECPPGYRLLGHSEVTCQFGTWAPNASVKCVPIPEEEYTYYVWLIISIILVFVLLFIGVALVVSNNMIRNYITQLIRSTSWAGCAEGGRFGESDLESDSKSDSESDSKSDLESDNSCLDLNRSGTSLLGYRPRNDTASSMIDMPPQLSYSDELNDYEYRTKDRGESADVPDQATVSPQRTTKCKEYIYPTKTVQASAVCRVTPLYAEDGDNNDDDSQTDQDPPETGGESPQSTDENTGRLNWNLLFRNLVPRVCTDNWKLCAIYLLCDSSSTEQSVNSTISRIENRSRTQQGGDKIEVILYNILWHWKYVSKNPRLKVIKQALNDSQHEDVYHDMDSVTKNCYVPVDDEEDSVIDKNNGLTGIPELEYRPIAQQQKKTKTPRAAVAMRKDKMSVDWILSNLYLNPVRTLNRMEYQMLTMYTIHKIRDIMLANTSLDDLLGITFEEYKASEHVSTTQSGTLHIISSGEFRVMLTDDVWTLVETYVRGARNAAVRRNTDNGGNCLFLTYEGKQVTEEYFNEKSNGTTDQNEIITQDENPDVKPSERSIDMDTDDEPGNKEMCTATMQSLDCETESPVSHNSDYVQCTKQVTKDENINDIADQTENDTQDQDPDVKRSERSIDMDTDADDEPGKQEMCTATMQSFDCITESPVSHGSDYAQRTKQVTKDETINDIADQTENDTQDQDPDVKRSERSIDMDTDADDEPGKQEMCTATMQSFDCITESPVSHSSDYAQRTKQVTKDENINDIADQTENDTQDQDPDVKRSERSIDMDTDADDEPGKQEMCTATMQSFDCITESPVSHGSDYAQRTKQVTKDEKINDIADQTENDTQDQDPDVKRSERSIDMDTDADDEPGKQEMCTATMQSFDCITESPVSHSSDYAQRTKQEPLLGKDNNVIHHGRRYFSENQKSTIEAVFKREIRQGSVKGSDILKGFDNSAELREVFGVQSKDVPNILVKKVADRVRCFIRKRKQQD